MLRDALKLYLVTNRNKQISDIEFLDIIEKSITGGVTSVQLREKNLEDDEFLKIAYQCKEITSTYSIPLFINDNLAIAKKALADGVHLGQSDILLNNAREFLGNDFIIGISVNNLSQLNNNQNIFADYISLGPIFHTNTKLDIEKPIGIEEISLLTKNKIKPTILIGGIKLDNIHQLMNSNVDGFAISSAIFNDQNPKIQASKFKFKINELQKGA